MTTSSKDSRAGARLIALITGLIIGEFAADRSETVARLVLFLWNRLDATTLKQHTVFQTQLVVLFLFAMIGGWLGARLAQRGWVEFQEVVLGIAGAVLVAVFTILDVLVPKTIEEESFGQASYFYYIAWAVALLIVPVLAGPGRQRSYEVLIRGRANFLAVVCGSAVIGFAVGYVIRLLPSWLTMLAPSLMTQLGAGSHDFADVNHFRNWESWIVSPATLDPLACAVVVVMFAPWLFPKTWGLEWKYSTQLRWAAAYGVLATFLTGFYGDRIYLYDDNKWIVAIGETSGLGSLFFIAFAAYALVFVLIVAVWLWRLPVAAWSRRVSLASALGLGFGLVSWVGLGGLLAAAGASPGQRLFFAIVHAVNGIALGILVSFIPASAERLDTPAMAESVEAA